MDLFCEIERKLDSISFYDALGIKTKPKNNLLVTGLRSNALAVFPKKLFFIFTALVFIGCSKAQENIVYTIKKGDHYSDHSNKIVGNVLEYDVYFDNSAVYDLGNSNQYDVNKLFGFNACNSLHHENSARFGWAYLDGNIEIYGYVYEGGVRDIFQLASISANEWHNYYLENNGHAYIFKVDHMVYVWDKQSNCISKYNYFLFPYFGGDEVAPHDITIHFKTP